MYDYKDTIELTKSVNSESKSSASIIVNDKKWPFSIDNWNIPEMPSLEIPTFKPPTLHLGKTHKYVATSNDLTMEVLITIISIIGIIVVLSLLCSCCRRTKNRGQVLSPPPANTSVTTAAYPQQQYTIAAYPVAHTATATATPYPAAPYPTNTGAYPTAVSPNVTGGAPYPTGGPPYPTGGAPYPTGGAPYPTAGAPYPTGGAPYPTGGAPYPTAGAPYLGSTAPDINALPPTYEQAVAGIEKQPPYNPSVPH